MILNINNLQNKIRGVFHIGAFIGEELSLYQYLNVKHIIFFEPVSHLYEILQQNVNGHAITYNVALGNYNGTAVINLSEFNPPIPYYTGASSSILKPKKHLEQHPNIVFNKTEEIQIRKLDSIIEEDRIDVTLYNMLNIDVQGYELEVLKGAQNTLQHIDYIITEVNNDEVYENCVLVNELDEFLLAYGFIRKETNWAGGIWGDALYVRQN